MIRLKDADFETKFFCSRLDLFVDFSERLFAVELGFAESGEVKIWTVENEDFHKAIFVWGWGLILL